MNECQTPYVEHSYRRHLTLRDLWICANCGDDRECTCAMTEPSQANCEVHGVDGFELWASTAKKRAASSTRTASAAWSARSA
jgi:hypothetical protein